MKTLPLLFASLLCVCTVFGEETNPRPTWIFNHGPDQTEIKLGGGALNSEFGLMKIVSQSTDLTLTVPLLDDDRFPAEERPIFAMRYRYVTPFTGAALFFATSEDPQLSDRQYVVMPVTGDHTWRNVSYDMSQHACWKGTIQNFRLDPTNPSDFESELEISRMGFFATEAEAEAFLSEADDMPDYASPSVFMGEKQRVFIPGNTLSGEFHRTDFMLKNTLSAAEIPCAAEMVVECGGKIVPMCDINRLGFTTFEAARAGAYRVRANGAVAEKLTDIAGHPREDAIRFVLARGLMKPTDAAHFSPDAPFSGKTTRAEAAQNTMVQIKKRLGTFCESPFPGEYFRRDRIRIGAWCNFNLGDVDETYMREYADAGFDWVIDCCGISAGTRRNDFFRWCNRYGIEVTVNDGAYRDPESKCAEYIDQPCVTGHYVTDEPGTEAYNELAAVCNPYAKQTGKIPFINLLPMYANAAQLKYGAAADAIEYYDPDPELFKKYCASFCEKFDTTYICTDIYPLNWGPNRKKVTYRDYIESINVIATEARRYRRDFWCCIQTFSWTPGKRTPTEAEFRWQCYSLMSFGCNGILCWDFAGWGEEFPSLVNAHSEKMPSWYDARTVFWELRRLSPVFVQYQNTGAFTHNCSDEVPYLKMSNPCTDFATIEEIQCPDPLLIGCFEDEKTGATAFTLVNMTELEAAAGTQVRLKLAADGRTVRAYYRGVPEVVTPALDGLYDFYLTSGEGVFVEVK